MLKTMVPQIIILAFLTCKHPTTPGVWDLNTGVTIFLRIIKNPEFGILLDMVGAKDAVFPKEEISRQYAGYHLNKLWKLGKHLGYGKYFREKNRSSP